MKKLLISLVLFVGLSSSTVQNIKWVAIGDSITYLNDHSEQTGNRVKKGYMTRVNEKLPHMFVSTFYIALKGVYVPSTTSTTEENFSK